MLDRLVSLNLEFTWTLNVKHIHPHPLSYLDRSLTACHLRDTTCDRGRYLYLLLYNKICFWNWISDCNLYETGRILLFSHHDNCYYDLYYSNYHHMTIVHVRYVTEYWLNKGANETNNLREHPANETPRQPICVRSVIAGRCRRSIPLSRVS